MVTSRTFSSKAWLLCLVVASLPGHAASSPAQVNTRAASRGPRDFPILRKRTPLRTGDNLLEWANIHRSHLQVKYGLTSGSATSLTQRKRSTSAAAMVNYQHDSTWYAIFGVGTPSQSLNLVLDTGSSDIWLAASDYSVSSSSTFSNSSSSFSITYGSGTVKGYMATETFTIADHTVTNQPFAVGTQITSELKDLETAGICGLGFPALSAGGSRPIWQSAGESEFSFYLQRASRKTTTFYTGGGDPAGTAAPGGFGKRASSDLDSAYGGVFTLGGTNSSLYQGDINWCNVISKSYWLITLGGVTVSNQTINIGSTEKAAIDTGTTLIGGPDSVVKDLYSRISGASAISGANGYYQFPCSTEVSTTMTFGDQKYSISSDQFNVAQVDSSGTYCMGAFFSIGSTSSSTLQWIVGDSFLSSVYSIFSNGDTARIGFASLASRLNDGGTSSTTITKTQQASLAASDKQRTMTLITAVAMKTVALAVASFV